MTTTTVTEYEWAPPPIPPRQWSAIRAASLAGISYRQLDYWARTGIVRPSIEPGIGSGMRRRYGYDDLVRLRLVRELLAGGIELERCRRALPRLTRLDADRFVVIVGDLAGTVDEVGLAQFIRGRGTLVVVVVLAGVVYDVDDAIERASW